MMRKLLYTLWALAGFAAQAQAQPSWTIRPSDFQYSMTLTAQIKVDRAVSADQTDVVAAFVNGQVRGVGSPNVLDEGGNLYVFLQIYSNQPSGETLTFSMYDASAAAEVLALNQLAFQSDQVLGSITAPYLIVDNYGPENLNLSTQSVAENQPLGTVVALVSAQDGNSAPSGLTYSLIQGEGDADNAKFALVGNNLQTAAVFDFETQAMHSIRLGVTDEQNERTEAIFVIMIQDINDAPSQVRLTPLVVSENLGLGELVSTLRVTDADLNPSAYTYTLVAGAGDANNSGFLIDQDRLLLNSTLDYETQSTLNLRLRAQDNADASIFVESALELTLRNINEAPTGISPASLTVAESLPVGAELTNLVVADPDQGDTHTIRLLNNTDVFSVNGDNKLILSGNLNAQVRNVYFLDLSAQDAQGLNRIERLTITVNNSYDTPVVLLFTPNQVDEAAETGTVGGVLQALNADAQANYTYALVAGTDNQNNDLFSLSGDQVLITEPLDYEALPSSNGGSEESSRSLRFRVRATETTSNTFIERAFTLPIDNVNEAPTSLTLSRRTIPNDTPIGATVATITVQDPENLDTHRFSLASTSNVFYIQGNTLRLYNALDFASQPNYAISLTALDSKGNSFTESLTISVTNAPRAAEPLSLDNNEVAENSPNNTLVGVFVLSGTLSGLSNPVYQLNDNRDVFEIRGNSLQVMSSSGSSSGSSLDYETQAVYTLSVDVSGDGQAASAYTVVVRLSDSNEAPTGIDLFPNSLAENSAINTLIGRLQAQDPETADTHTFSLVEGEGDTNNALFNLRGSDVLTREALDYEAQTSYTIRVQAADANGGTVQEALSIAIRNVNEAPTSIRFSPINLSEEQAIGSVIGRFTTQDPDAGDTFSYYLNAGEGATDNDRFAVVGNELRARTLLDYETKAVLSIRIVARDLHGATLAQPVTIPLEDQNESPDGIALSSNQILENLPIGTVVGGLSTPNFTAATYRIVEEALPGTFGVDGNNLVTLRVLDYERYASYQVRISAQDASRTIIYSSFQIIVQDGDDPPTGLRLTHNSQAENVPIGESIGNIELIDVDGNIDQGQYNFLFASGEGDADNAQFAIERNTLSNAAVLDYESQSQYTVRIVAQHSSGFSLTQVLNITLEDANDAPSAVLLSSATHPENTEPGALIGLLSCEDQDVLDVCVFQLDADLATSGLFNIIGNRLYSQTSFDAEQTTNYTFAIKGIDRYGAEIDSEISLTIQDQNDPPSLDELDLTLREDALNNTLVGTITAQDQDGHSISYALAEADLNNSNSPDAQENKNAYYKLEANGDLYLLDNSELDYETDTLHVLEVVLTDTGTPSASATLRVGVRIIDIPDLLLPAPLAISPNGDGINDYWEIQNVEIYEAMEFTIFNELGQEIYNSQGYKNQWNGTYKGSELPKGVYYYMLEDQDGKVAYRGTISILR